MADECVLILIVVRVGSFGLLVVIVLSDTYEGYHVAVFCCHLIAVLVFTTNYLQVVWDIDGSVGVGQVTQGFVFFKYRPAVMTWIQLHLERHFVLVGVVHLLEVETGLVVTGLLVEALIGAGFRSRVGTAQVLF